MIHLDADTALVHFHGEESITGLTLDLLIYDNLKDFVRTATLPSADSRDWRLYDARIK